MGSWTRALAILVHAVLVLALCGNFGAAIAFFAISGGLVWARRFVPDRLRGVYVGAAIIFVVALTLRFRGGPIGTGAGLGPLSPLATMPLAFLGVSYAFLRIIRALLDPRDWSARDLAHYYLFFPTFFSGPVFEPRDFPGAAERPSLSTALARILGGLVRIGAASILATMVPLASRAGLSFDLAWPIPLLWLGVFASGVWLYLNFSGYSEIYIGLAALAGARAPENFDNPYAATDITAFWQRWHMSLGAWLRSTIYSPLTRRAVAHSTAATAIAGVAVPIVTMAVCGAWHMVAPAFLIWGLLHGAALGAHWTWGRIASPHLSGALRASAPYRATSWIATHTFVALSWVFFLPAEPAVELQERLRFLFALFGAHP